MLSPDDNTGKTNDLRDFRTSGRKVELNIVARRGALLGDDFERGVTDGHGPSLRARSSRRLYLAALPALSSLKVSPRNSLAGFIVTGFRGTGESFPID